jgi:hypothetical protein
VIWRAAESGDDGNIGNATPDQVEEHRLEESIELVLGERNEHILLPFSNFG